MKNIHTLHDIQYVYPSGLLIYGEEKKWFNSFWLRKWYAAWCRRWLGSPSEVHAPSQWLLDFYSEKGFFRNSEKKVVRPFEVKPENIIKDSYSKPVKLIYIGGIEEHKGILWVVEALKQSDLEFKLDIYGTGSQVKKLEKLVNNDPRLIYHGQLAHDQVEETFAQADITLVPSLTYENAPTVIYESLQAGTPILASRIGGIPEIVNENNGWLFEAGDERDFLRIIR